MAFDKKPSTWIANWSEDGTNVTLPIASVPELSAADADATTGDIRKVVFALMEKLYAAWVATAVADRPTQMTIAKVASQNVTTGVITNIYTVTCKSAVLTQEVADEPS